MPRGTARGAGGGGRRARGGHHIHSAWKYAMLARGRRNYDASQLVAHWAPCASNVGVQQAWMDEFVDFVAGIPAGPAHADLLEPARAFGLSGEAYRRFLSITCASHSEALLSIFCTSYGNQETSRFDRMFLSIV